MHAPVDKGKGEERPDEVTVDDDLELAVLEGQRHEANLCKWGCRRVCV